MEQIFKFCQSCGMPMKKDERGGGTNAVVSIKRNKCQCSYTNE